jgi:hypothetical protein
VLLIRTAISRENFPMRALHGSVDQSFRGRWVLYQQPDVFFRLLRSMEIDFGFAFLQLFFFTLVERIYSRMLEIVLLIVLQV